MSRNSIPRTSMVESLLLQLPLRIFIGGIFVYAAYNKIPAIQSFAEAIKGFRVVDPETNPELIVIAAFVIPWFEAIAGLLLIIGLRARSAALGIGLLFAMFIYGLTSVILGGVDANCSCFGDTNVICDSTVGWCQVIRNVVLLIPTVYLLWRGPGRLSLDQKLSGSDQNPDNGQYSAQSLGGAVDEDGLRA